MEHDEFATFISVEFSLFIWQAILAKSKGQISLFWGSITGWVNRIFAPLTIKICSRGGENSIDPPCSPVAV